MSLGFVSAYGPTNGPTSGVGFHATVTRKKEGVVATRAEHEEHEEAEALTLEDRVSILERQVANLTSTRTTGSAELTEVAAMAASADATDAAAASVDTSVEDVGGDESPDDGFEDTN
jgi:hypothetical protein